MIEILGVVALASIGLNLALLFMLRSALTGMRELSTEAILSSRATSAMDLATAQINVRAFEDERQHLVETRKAATKKAAEEQPSGPLLPDGTPLHVLRQL